MQKTAITLIIGILLGILGYWFWTGTETSISPIRENQSRQKVETDNPQILEEFKKAQESDDIESCKKLTKESLRSTCEENIKTRKKNNELNIGTQNNPKFKEKD